MKATINGIETRFEVDGNEDGPWLTLANSLGTTVDLWAPQLEEFGKDYHILRYDIRGHGETEGPDGAYSPADLRDDLLALLDHVGVDNTHMAAISISGMTITEAALAAPDRVNSITVANAPTLAPDEMKKGWDERIGLVEEGGIEAVVDTMLTRWFTEETKDNRPDLIGTVREMILKTTKEGYIGCARALQQLDYMDRLKDLKCPAMFIAGAQDHAAPSENLKKAAEAAPNGRFEIIEPAGHLSNLENPKGYNALLKDFLGNL